MVNKVLGTAGDDTLYSTKANDAIWGGAGGHDIAVFSGDMADYAITANKDGSYQVTDLRAGSPDGSDKVRAIDTFRFADGDYSLADFIAAQNGEIRGTDNDDALLGTSGDDVFDARAGTDSIWGGTGGTDTLKLSGVATDYEIVANANGSYTITDTRANGDGVKTVRSIEQFQFSDTTLSLTAFIEAHAENSINENVGTAGDDVLLGGVGNDTFSGGAGNDTIWGGKDGDDIAVYSGNFEDYGLALSGNGAYYVYDKRPGAPDGVDKVRGIEVFQFADQIVTLEEFLAAMPNNPGFNLNGSNNDDVLIGDDFNDTLETKAGRDRAWGGFDGEDTLILKGDYDDYVLTDNGNGSFTLTYVGADATSSDIQVIRSVEKVQFDDGVYLLQDIFQNDAADEQTIARKHIGTAADDVFKAAHTDGLRDAHTNDVMAGNGGDDKVYGGYGDDVIYGDETPGQQSQIAPSIIRNTDLPTFVIGEGLYQVINGQLKELNVETGEYDNIGPRRELFNAMGLNEADGYAYALGTHGSVRGHLLRIGSNGEMEDLGGGFPAKWAGATYDNALYVFTGKRQLTRINLDTLEQTKINFGGTNSHTVHDLVFVGEVAYGVSPLGVLVAFDLSSGEVSSMSIDGAPVGQGAFGAGWTAADGGLYFSHNKTGGVYGISGVETGAPSAALVVQGGKSSTNDGFSAGSADLPDSLSEAGDDELLGGGGDDDLFGGEGQDNLDGGEGADALDGGMGQDRADYSRAAARVEMSLKTGGTVGEATGDTYVSVEDVKGSKFNDVLEGDDGVNHIHGDDGDDIIRGEGGDDVLTGGLGADDMDGGAGFDTVSYYKTAQGVTMSLEHGGSGGGEENGDAYVNIERVVGSTYNDRMSGDANANTLEGMEGNDALNGGGGCDTLNGGDGADTLNGGAGNDKLQGGEGDDWLNGGDGADSIWGQGGVDRAAFDGSLSDYVVTKVDDADAANNPLFDHVYYYTVEHKATGDVDRVRDVELLHFANGVYNTDTQTFEAM